MEESNQSAGEANGPKKEALNGKKAKEFKGIQSTAKDKSSPNQDDREVLLKVGPFAYKLPGKRQRVVIASIVLGLNLLLVLAVVVYFYSPAFQSFVFNVGR